MRKKQCEAALEELVAEKVMSLKEYGKAKVFLINQDRFPATDTSELETMDEKISDLRDQFRGLTDEVTDLDKQLK